jgi:hypothetical protein
LANVMPHAQWLKLTYGGLTSIRSSQLKKVDNALAEYHKTKTPASLDTLRTALVGWMQKEGPKWKTSVRNKFGAVADLYKQVMDLPGPAKTAQDIVAVSHVRDESRAIVTELFRGKTLDWRPGFLKKLATTKFAILKNVRSVEGNVNVLSHGAVRHGVQGAAHALRTDMFGGHGGASSPAESFCRSLISPELVGDVMAFIARELPTFMKDLAVSLTPFVGVIASGAGTFANACKTVRDQYRLYEARVHQERSLSIDEPEKAIEGLVRILERERDAQGARTAIGAAEFTGKLTGVLADGGTVTNAAVGLAANLANLTLFVLEIVRDVRERNEANKLMASPRGVDAKVFVASPIVGAYLIGCAPTSVLVNTVFDRFFEQGWRGEVERTVLRHIAPLQTQARRVVTEHRFWIPALQNFPGMLAVNKKKLKEMAAKNGKTGMVGFGSENMPAELN